MRANIQPDCGLSPDEGAPSPLPECLTRYTGFLIAKAHQRIFTLFHAECQKLQLEVPAPGILSLLEINGPMSQQQLGRLLRIDRTTMVKMVDLLEKQKLARRTNHPDDRRIYLVEITPAGRRRAAAFQKIAERMEHELFASFSEAERNVIRRALLTLAG